MFLLYFWYICIYILFVQYYFKVKEGERIILKQFYLPGGPRYKTYMSSKAPEFRVEQTQKSQVILFLEKPNETLEINITSLNLILLIIF